MILPEPIEKLVNAFNRLPGIGPKTASRLAFFLLRAQDEVALDLAQALEGLKRGVVLCQTCFHITTAERTECEICTDIQRDGRVVCVVEEPLDVVAMERAGAYQGKYHVLHGVLSPIEGVGPDDLRVRELLERVQMGISVR